MTVTELLTRNNLNTISTVPDRDGSFNFPSGIGTGDPFLDGVHLHAGLRLLRFNRPKLSPRYERLWPALTAIRAAVTSFGGERIVPEVLVTRSGLSGRVDLRADGPQGIGHVEVKVVGSLPGAPRQRDLRQMSLYLSMAKGRSPSWSALIYLNMVDGQARYFIFSDAIGTLMDSAESMGCN